MRIKIENEYGSFEADFYEGQPHQPLFIFIHGALSTISIWDPLYKNFLKNGNILIISLPGHYPSSLNWKKISSLQLYVEILQDIIFQFSINFKQKILIGHSIGGTISIILNSFYQKEYHKIISITPPISKDLGLLSPLNIPVNLIDKTSFFEDSLWKINHDSLVNLSKNHKDMFFDIISFFGIANFNLNDKTKNGIYRFIQEIQNFDSQTLKSMIKLANHEFQKKISIFDNLSNGHNVLIIGAYKDTLVSKENHRKAAELINSYYFELDNAGHFCILENHYEIYEKIISFI